MEFCAKLKQKNGIFGSIIHLLIFKKPEGRRAYDRITGSREKAQYIPQGTRHDTGSLGTAGVQKQVHPFQI